ATAQSSLIGGLRRHNLVGNRQDSGGIKLNADIANRIGVVGIHLPAVELSLQVITQIRILILDFEIDGALFAETKHQLLSQSLECRRRLPIHSNNFLTRLNAGSGRNRTWGYTVDNGSNPLNTRQKNHPVGNNGQQEIGDGTGADHSHALPYRLVVERIRNVSRSDIALALIHHFDIATEGKYGEHKFCALAIVPAGKGSAKTYGKAQHLNATTASHPKVAKLVDGHQNSQGNQSKEQGFCDF